MLDLILDKGLVIDAYVRVSVVGIEILTIDARIVVASVDTYLHFAEAVNRLDLQPTETQGIQGLFGDGDQTGDTSTEASRNGDRRSRRTSSPRAVTKGGDGAEDADGDGQPGVAKRLAQRARFEGN